MVREMMGSEGGGGGAQPARVESQEFRTGTGQVVQGDRGTTYVGATHFMAMLDDVRTVSVAAGGAWEPRSFLLIRLAD